MRKTKKAWSSKIIISSLLLFIIGLEPFVPQIQAILPNDIGMIVAVVLPIVIMLARIFADNEKIVIKLKKPLN